MIYRLLRPLFFQTNPEWIHRVVMRMLEHTPMAAFLTCGRAAPRQPVKLWNLTFPNRLGLAAGFDKDAEALRAWKNLGFGHVEIGTVTPRPQAGNPKPRLFRCPQQEAIINRMGFNNKGVDFMAEKLRAYRKRYTTDDFVIGINIGKNKDTPLEQAAEDYLYCFKKLAELGDFFVINVSSPNTPGLRSLQQPELLRPIFSALQAANDSNKPILVKIAPDLELAEIAAILETAIAHRIAGVVATNTTIDHSSVALHEQGGLSGRPLAKKSTDIIRFIHQETKGQLPIIGVGGVFTRDDFQEKLDAGATLVQVYTGFIYQGPLIAHHVLKQP
ncbi:MAG: quinone-dependent dihydroorotate dehydrogenase [bacterium]